MPDIYNSILTTYTSRFDELSIKAQFHFASRLYLWNQAPQAAKWLEALRAGFIIDDDPLKTLRHLAKQPLPQLSRTAAIREPFFQKYPDLQLHERLLFRALFMETVYGVPSSSALATMVPFSDLRETCRHLARDQAALIALSSFALNFIALADRFLGVDSPTVNTKTLLSLSATGQDSGDRFLVQLRCYFLTHVIIGATQFYARAIPAQDLSAYRAMLELHERLLLEHPKEVRIDNICEFLACCRMVGYESPLRPVLENRLTSAIGHEGYLEEPSARIQSLQLAEHRNVLYLMSSQAYTPLER